MSTPRPHSLGNSTFGHRRPGPSLVSARRKIAKFRGYSSLALTYLTSVAISSRVWNRVTPPIRSSRTNEKRIKYFPDFSSWYRLLLIVTRPLLPSYSFNGSRFNDDGAIIANVFRCINIFTRLFIQFFD